MGQRNGPDCFNDIHRCIVKPGYGDLKDYTIRERMLYVDAQMTQFMCGVHPFIGSPRPEGYYIERINDHLPEVLQSLARAATVVRSILEEHCEGRDPGFPPPLKKEGPRGPRPLEEDRSDMAAQTVSRKQAALETLAQLTSCEEKVA
jgi:hypothetical protein